MSSNKKTPAVKQLDPVPFKPYCLGVDTKFAHLLNISNIESLFKKINLIDLNKVSQENRLYIKGATDAIYALIGVDTPLRKVIEADPTKITDVILSDYINSVTAYVETQMALQKNTKKELVKLNREEAPAALLDHIFTQVKERDNKTPAKKAIQPSK